MKCAELHELAAAYALDALAEDERVACLHHLEHEGPHEGCEELLARYERTLGELGALTPQGPAPRSLWSAIELRLGLGHLSDAPSERVPHTVPRWRERAGWMVAAAALIAGFWLRGEGERTAKQSDRERGVMEEALASTNEQLASTEAARKECGAALAKLTGGALSRDAVSLLEHPATKITPLAPAGTRPYRATSLYNPELKRALIVSGTLAPIEGKDFELWIIAAGESTPRPAGFVRFDASGVAIGELDANLLAGTKPAAFAVSLEPAGGRPTPTEVVLLGKLQG